MTMGAASTVLLRFRTRGYNVKQKLVVAALIVAYVLTWFVACAIIFGIGMWGYR
jgi:hypothetical protein